MNELYSAVIYTIKGDEETDYIGTIQFSKPYNVMKLISH